MLVQLRSLTSFCCLIMKNNWHETDILTLTGPDLFTIYLTQSHKMHPSLTIMFVSDLNYNLWAGFLNCQIPFFKESCKVLFVLTHTINVVVSPCKLSKLIAIFWTSVNASHTANTFRVQNIFYLHFQWLLLNHVWEIQHSWLNGWILTDMPNM